MGFVHDYGISFLEPLEPGPVSSFHPYNQEIKEVKEMIRGRKRRLDRMVGRRNQLAIEKTNIERGMSFFQSKASDVKKQPLENCPLCMTQPANVITQCGHLFCRVCMVKCLKNKHECPICKSSMKTTDAHEIKLDSGNSEQAPVIDEQILRYGTKLTKMLELVKKIVNGQEKVVIFAQWGPLMHSIKEMLKENNIDTVMVFGNAVCQNAAVKKFKTTSTPVIIGCMDQTNSTTGLDLMEANHLIFAHALVGNEDYVIKAMEEQAIARIHRTGQTKKVHIYWLITRGTVEEQTYLATRNV